MLGKGTLFFQKDPGKNFVLAFAPTLASPGRTCPPSPSLCAKAQAERVRRARKRAEADTASQPADRGAD